MTAGRGIVHSKAGLEGKSIPRIPGDDIEFTPLPHSVEPSEITKDSRFHESCFWLFFPSLFARNLLRPGEGGRE